MPHDVKDKNWTDDANSLVERLKAFIGLGTGDPLAGGTKSPTTPPAPSTKWQSDYMAREAAEAAKRMNAGKKPVSPVVKALSAPPKRPRL